MACRGVHFAIDATIAQRLLASVGDDEALMAVVEEIEQAWDGDHVAESDKAWDAIHRCLTDGELLYDNGEYPLNRVVVGGQQLHEGDDYTVSYVSPSMQRTRRGQNGASPLISVLCEHHTAHVAPGATPEA